MMIELPPDVESGLMAQAEAKGLALPRYVEYLLREHIPVHSDLGLSPSERADAWIESAKALPHTPPLSEEAISRESIYSDRG